jgi:hypothetical protein
MGLDEGTTHFQATCEFIFPVECPQKGNHLGNATAEDMTQNEYFFWGKRMPKVPSWLENHGNDS